MKFKFSASGDRIVWTCSGKLPLTSWGVTPELLRHEISEAVAAYIMEEKEQELAARLLVAEFQFQDEEELERVLQWFLLLLEKEDGASAEFHRRRRKELTDSIAACFIESSELNLDGWMTFRMHGYKQELREMAEYAVDEFMLDQQYEEFVSLLKYFVYFQEPLMPLVHVIHKGGEDFILLDGNLKPIEKHEHDELVMEKIDQDMQIEDMVVSTLISVSPAKMVIHTREPELPVILTLSHIFDQRAEICCCCAECSHFLGGMGSSILTVSASPDYNNC
ncbi:putative sporulation protein YtxC [Paenibacillus lemnae]|uniref:putative sporulation protein YtxC n=1 Tax=Paenibacillus lemnae TaxID=1330551 RepID=UPI001FE8016D|nr:putative sporulation protein YtxC [Paenibacillus lemnae]